MRLRLALVGVLTVPLVVACSTGGDSTSADGPSLPPLALYTPPSVQVPTLDYTPYSPPPFDFPSIAVPSPVVTTPPHSAEALGVADLPPLSVTGEPVRLSKADGGHAWREVAVVQLALDAADDAGLDPDGYFGDATESAVRAFQQRAGITVDGVVGPDTLKALIGALSKAGGAVPPPVPLPPSSGPTLPPDYTYYGFAGGSVCADGWISPSQGSGTCSWHGGIG